MKRVLGRGLEALIPGAGDDKDVTITAGINVIREIPVSRIKPSPFQPRLSFERSRLEELAQSISARGVIQPIVVRGVGDGFELIVGERRLRALEILGRATVPAIVYDAASNEEAMELTLIENIQREDLNPIEEARAYHRLMTACSLTQNDVAEKVGRDRSSIANSLRLLTLPEEIQNMLADGKLSAGHARALLAVGDDGGKIELAGRIIREEMSVRDLEKLVYADKSQKRGKRIRLRSTQVLALEEQLKRRLGTKVFMTQRKKGGRIIIEYYSNDELDRLLEIFGIRGNT